MPVVNIAPYSKDDSIREITSNDKSAVVLGKESEVISFSSGAPYWAKGLLFEFCTMLCV